MKEAASVHQSQVVGVAVPARNSDPPSSRPHQPALTRDPRKSQASVSPLSALWPLGGTKNHMPNPPERTLVLDGRFVLYFQS